MRFLTYGHKVRAGAWAQIGLVACCSLAVAAVTLPTMRPGFWKTSSSTITQTGGKQPDTSTNEFYRCDDAATLAESAKLLTNGGGVPGCKFDVEGSGHNYTVTGTCPNPGGTPGTLSSKATVVFDGDTAMHAVSNVTMPSMQMTIHDVTDSKWLGACPAGAKPGDIGTMKNGAFQKREQ
jgi:hypothetical protein